MAKSSNVKDSVNKAGFPIPVGNYKMILIGFGIVILGFILMMGGGSEIDQFIMIYSVLGE